MDDEIRMSVSLEGMLGRECPEPSCEKYFKIKPGTGIADNLEMSCPYCSYKGTPDQFFTKEQIEYGESIALRHVTGLIDKELKKMERHSVRGSFISLQIKVKSTPTPIKHYVEKELQKNILCEDCGCEYAIYGVFAICPDCRTHNLFQIFSKNLDLVKKQLTLEDELYKRFGETNRDDIDSLMSDIRNKLIENACEDAVTIYETFCKEAYKQTKDRAVDPSMVLRGNPFQSLDRAKSIFLSQFNNMKIKNSILFFFISLIILSVFSPNTHADVLTGKTYQQTVHKYIVGAERSITVAMYFIILEPEGTGPINELVNDLVDAEKRGVQVKVVLEDTKLKENRLAYEKLRKAGVNVYFDTRERLLHVKGIVVDERYVFLGSANWSRAAIERNYEATNFTDSKQDALVFKEYVDNILVQDKDVLLPIIEGIHISTNFLLENKGGRILLKSKAASQFDLYILLNKMAQEKGKNSFEIDYDVLAKEMGYKAPDKLGRYRNLHHYFYERTHRSLKRLRGYKLIDYKKGIVTLKSSIGEKSIIIPHKYWQDNFPDKFSTRAKYMYLICLYEAARSTRYPFWFRSQKGMSKLYGISDTTISLGLQELEDAGIIGVTRDELNPNDFSDRDANVYEMR
ncbi:MAG: phospholipase D-like domain-containing protein [Candidatus Omnitrophica bacterium]|nr:phospholipase D-like domain-containing protein [Candidatus Omnitrophota bacterium]